jgi:hypothetical protein
MTALHLFDDANEQSIYRLMQADEYEMGIENERIMELRVDDPKIVFHPSCLA